MASHIPVTPLTQAVNFLPSDTGTMTKSKCGGLFQHAASHLGYLLSALWPVVMGARVDN